MHCFASLFGFQGTCGFRRSPRTFFQVLVGLGRLEPPTSRLSGVRSNHLSYKPIREPIDSQTLVLRKEVIQPHLPIRLPCYDFTPVTSFALGSLSTDFGHPRLPWCDGRCVQDPGTHSPRHSDPRLLGSFASLCDSHCSTCVAQNIRGMMI